jgi:hypothetical protein
MSKPEVIVLPSFTLSYIKHEKHQSIYHLRLNETNKSMNYSNQHELFKSDIQYKKRRNIMAARDKLVIAQ